MTTVAEEISISRSGANRTAFVQGMKDGIPIMTGYFAVSFALGIAMRSAGLSVVEGLMMSVLNTASAGEYAGITMIVSNASLFETALMTLIVNARYFLMSCALSQKLSEHTFFGHRLGISFAITDELFAIAASRKGHLNPFYYYGAAFVAIPGWAAGTVLGVIAGSALPSILVDSLSVALYGMFLAVIIPPCKGDRILRRIVICSFVLSYLASVLPGISSISSGTQIIVLTVAIAAFAAWKHPIPEEQR
jgi:4-azaleucine resistance transporter AzlC